MKTFNMMVNAHNYTRWKHRCGWHNRGCVRDRFASEWAREEDWTEERNTCASRLEERFRDFRPDEVRHPVVHSPTGEHVKANQEHRENRGQLDPTKLSGHQVKAAGDSKLAERLDKRMLRDRQEKLR